MTDRKPSAAEPETSAAQDAARVALGTMLAVTGVSHLTIAREAFKAQVPDWVPASPDTVVVQSGVVEIALGAALVVLPRHKRRLGLIAAAFFAGVFPGNVAQYTHRRDGFGLDTDSKRFVRLLFQPVLILWALWAAGVPLPRRRER